MKQSFLTCAAIVALLFILGCTADNVTAPGEDPGLQAPTFLAKRTLAYFYGESVTFNVLDFGKTDTLPTGTIHTRGLIVQTQDDLSDDRVSGVVTWVVNMDIYPNGEDKRWGTGELIIPDRGSWQLPYVGWAKFDPDDGKKYVTYEVEGHGKGEFKGLKGHWTYKKEALPGIPFNVTGFIYERN